MIEKTSEKYTIDQLMENRDYQRICEAFLNLNLTEQERKDIKEILNEGTYNKKNFLSKYEHRDSPEWEIQRRCSMAFLYLKNRNSLNYISQNNIKLFHGTTSRALPIIINIGVSTVDKLKEKGIEVQTGEEWSRYQGKRDFISLTDVLEVAENYSYIKKNSEYPVVIGTTDESIKHLGIRSVNSDISEIAITKDIPPEDIKVIMVPSNKIREVKRLISSNTTQVLPLDTKDKFYWTNDEEIYLSTDSYHKYQNKQYFEKKIKASAMMRTISSIKDNFFKK